MRATIKTSNIPYFCAIFVFFDYLSQVALNDLRLLLRIDFVQFSSFSYYFIFFVLMFLCVYYNKLHKKQVLLVFAYYLFFALAYFYAFLVNPKTFEFITDGNKLLLFLYFPAILLVFSYTFDYEKLMSYLIQFTRVYTVLVFISVLYEFIKSGNRVESYDMIMGYQAALCAIVLVFSLFRNFKIYDLILVLALSLIVFFTSSRGAVVVLIAYFSVSIFRKYFRNARSYVKILFVFLSLLVIRFLFIYGLGIIKYAIAFAQQFNINTRTLNAILQNDISVVASNEYRIQYINQCIKEWNNMPILGLGLFSDRRILNGIYVHNIIIEFITDYGFFVGSILLLALIYLIIREIKKDTIRTEFLILISLFSLIHLLVSGSYLTSTMFFIMLSVLLSGVFISEGRPDYAD